MNLTWHILKKDLVRMRLPILVWALFLGSQVFVSNRLLSIRSVDYSWFAETGMLLNLLVAVGLVVSFIMAAFLVLDDPLVGTDMFWVTRPISGGRLLHAKLLLAGLIFGLVPVLIWSPWWLYCDFSIGDMAVASVRVLGVQVLAVTPAFVLASLVGQTGRFVFFSVLAAAAVLVGFLNFMTWEGHHALPADLVQTRLLLVLGLLVVCGVVVVSRQYLTRRFVSSAIILGIGVVLAAAVAVCWPWDLVNLRSKTGAQMAATAGIAAEIQEVRIAALANTSAPENIGVSITILFKGAPDDVSLASGLADVELRWPDGGKITGSSLKMAQDYWSAENEKSAVLKALGLPATQAWLYHWDPETEAKQAEMSEAARKRASATGGYWRDPKRHPGEARLTLTLPVTPENATKIDADRPACSISARIFVKRPEQLFEMPLKGDTWATGPGARLHMLALAPATWRGVNHEPLKTYLTTVASASAPNLDGLSLYTVDRNHGTALFQGRTSSYSVIPVATNIEGLYFSIADPMMWRTDKWIESPGWQESATLVAVTYQDIGGFNREVHADRLVIGKVSEN